MTDQLRVAAHAVCRTAAPDTGQGGKGCAKKKDNDEPVWFGVMINNECESQGQDTTAVFTAPNVKMFPLPSASCPRDHRRYHLGFISAATLRNAESGSD